MYKISTNLTLSRHNVSRSLYYDAHAVVSQCPYRGSATLQTPTDQQQSAAGNVKRADCIDHWPPCLHSIDRLRGSTNHSMHIPIHPNMINATQIETREAGQDFCRCLHPSARTRHRLLSSHESEHPRSMIRSTLDDDQENRMQGRHPSIFTIDAFAGAVEADRPQPRPGSRISAQACRSNAPRGSRHQMDFLVCKATLDGST